MTFVRTIYNTHLGLQGRAGRFSKTIDVFLIFLNVFGVTQVRRMCYDPVHVERLNAFVYIESIQMYNIIDTYYSFAFRLALCTHNGAKHYV